MPLHEAGADNHSFCRRCVGDELCHQVKELQEEVSRLCSIHENEQEIDRLFSETLQSQESQPPFAVEMQVGSEPCQALSQRSVEYEGWKLATACTRKKAPPSPETLKMTSRTGTFYNRYEALELEGQSTDEVDDYPFGIEMPPHLFEKKGCCHR